MMKSRLLLALAALVTAIGLIAVFRARRIAAVEADFAAGDLPVG
jgi:hypothetical protein